MRIGTWLGLLICCCAGLTACTAAAPTGPEVTVTTPSVGRPPAPDSTQAALSREAFTPYAGLGASTDDGLAPGETYDALHTACMASEGESSPDAGTLAQRELTALGLRGLTPASGSGPTAAQDKAQIAVAVTDAACTKELGQLPRLLTTAPTAPAGVNFPVTSRSAAAP